jgi:hypothetical protein
LAFDEEKPSAKSDGLEKVKEPFTWVYISFQLVQQSMHSFKICLLDITKPSNTRSRFNASQHRLIISLLSLKDKKNVKTSASQTRRQQLFFYFSEHGRESFCCVVEIGIVPNDADYSHYSR